MKENESSLVKTSVEIAMDREVQHIRKELQVDRNRLMYHVDRGMQGLNEGMYNGMPRVNQLLDGTQRGTYYLMGADSSVGKTTIGDFMFVYSLYIATKAKGIKLDLDYYSYEISLPMKKAKWASLLYYLKYDQELPMSVILGRNPIIKLTADQYAKIKVVSIEIEEMFDSFRFVEVPTRPSEVWSRWLDKAETYGELKKDTKKSGKLSEVVGYSSRYPKVFKMTIIDHVALAELEKGLDTKRTMDLQSALAVRARNLFDESVLFIQQFNNSLQASSRDRKTALAYLPSRMDFGDSTYTFRDADVVFGLTKPSSFQLESFGDYTELDSWGNYFILMTLMKNRYGKQGDNIPIFLNSIVGKPEELPINESWNALIQDRYIAKAKELNRLWQ